MPHVHVVTNRLPYCNPEHDTVIHSNTPILLPGTLPGIYFATETLNSAGFHLNLLLHGLACAAFAHGICT